MNQEQLMEMTSDEMKVVMSGMALMYSKETAQLLDQAVNAEAPIPQKLAMEIAGLMRLIDERTPNGIPPAAIPKGAFWLVNEFALFLTQSGKGKPTKEDIKEAMILLRPYLADFARNGKAVRPKQGAQPAAGQPMQPAPSAPSAPQQPAGLINSALGA